MGLFARAIDTYKLHRRAVEADALEYEAGPESSRMEIIVPNDARTGITDTTSPGRRTAPIYLPPPPEWADRVYAQRARDQAIRETGRSEIPDQGVTFQGHLPFDARMAATTTATATAAPRIGAQTVYSCCGYG